MDKKRLLCTEYQKETNIFEFAEDILYPVGFKMHFGIIVFLRKMICNIKTWYTFLSCAG